MSFAIWALVIGALLTTMALSGTSLRRLPLSSTMLYLAAGYALGPAGWALMAPDPLTYSVILERVAEVAVLISLFTVGLRLGLPLLERGWRLPVRLAIVSMTIRYLRPRCMSPGESPRPFSMRVWPVSSDRQI